MKLIFVYNADTGIFNAMTDAIHKVLYPSTYQCKLCFITYGLTFMQSEWRDFIDDLDFEKTFLHRNEFAEQYPNVKAELPAVYVTKGDSIEPIMTATEIGQCNDLQALIEAMEQKLSTVSQP